METNYYLIAYETLSMSILPWLIGSVIGGIVGHFVGARLSSLLKGNGRARTALVLLPLRSLTLGALMMLIPTVFRATTEAGIVFSGIASAAILMLPVSFLLVVKANLDHRFEPSVPNRIAGTLRSLAVISFPISIIATNLSGGGGAGLLWWSGYRLNDASMMWQGLLVMLPLSIMIDLGMGAFQAYELRRRELKELEANQDPTSTHTI